MPDPLLAAVFPVRGIDRSLAHGGQRPGTTPVGKNVRVLEPTTMRLRGGSRPGLARLMARLPTGNQPFQELNIVIISAFDGIPTGIDDPGIHLIDDPSSDGPPDTWGSFPLGFDDPYSPGTPMTGASQGTRNPIGQDGGRSKRRKEGSGVQPNKNVLNYAPPPGPIPHQCFAGLIRIVVTKPFPDPFNFTGTQPIFDGGLCAPYVAGNSLYTGPKTAFVMKRTVTDSDSPEGTLLPDHIAAWLWNNVGHDSYGAIIADYYSAPPGGSCTAGSTCAGALTATIPGESMGAVINAAPL